MGHRSDRLIWEPLAELLAERSQDALFAVDEWGLVRLFNGPMEQITGWSRRELLGQPWRMLAADESETPARSGDWLGGALSGTSTRVQCEILTRVGDRLWLELDLSLVATDQQRLVLARVEKARRLTAPAGDISYDIERGGTFGRLRSVSRLGVVPQEYGSESRCFRVLHGRSAPCEPCPVKGLDGDTSAVTVHVADAVVEILTASVTEEETVHVNVRSLTRAELLAAARARVSEIVKRSNLSEWECAVFDGLLLGRSLRDIALELGVSVRTVRFHQDNVLRKIGAESKADMLRVLL